MFAGYYIIIYYNYISNQVYNVLLNFKNLYVCVVLDVLNFCELF